MDHGHGWMDHHGMSHPHLNMIQHCPNNVNIFSDQDENFCIGNMENPDTTDVTDKYFGLKLQFPLRPNSDVEMVDMTDKVAQATLCNGMYCSPFVSLIKDAHNLSFHKYQAITKILPMLPKHVILYKIAGERYIQCQM